MRHETTGGNHLAGTSMEKCVLWKMLTGIHSFLLSGFTQGLQTY